MERLTFDYWTFVEGIEILEYWNNKTIEKTSTHFLNSVNLIFILILEEQSSARLDNWTYQIAGILPCLSGAGLAFINTHLWYPKRGHFVPNPPKFELGKSEIFYNIVGAVVWEELARGLSGNRQGRPIKSHRKLTVFLHVNPQAFSE